MEPVSVPDLQMVSSSKTAPRVQKTNPKRTGKENIEPITSVKIATIYFHKLAGHPSWPVRVTGVSKAGKPELHYFGTNQVGTAKQNLKDLYPYTKQAKTVFNSCLIKNQKMKLALAEADAIVL